MQAAGWEAVAQTVAGTQYAPDDRSPTKTWKWFATSSFCSFWNAQFTRASCATTTAGAQVYRAVSAPCGRWGDACKASRAGTPAMRLRAPDRDPEQQPSCRPASHGSPSARLALQHPQPRLFCPTLAILAAASHASRHKHLTFGKQPTKPAPVRTWPNSTVLFTLSSATWAEAVSLNLANP